VLFCVQWVTAVQKYSQ